MKRSVAGNDVTKLKPGHEKRNRRARFRLTASVAGLLLGGFPAAGRADILYVANSGNNTIAKVTSSGVSSVFASSGLSKPTGVAFDRAGNLYVANSGNDTIVKFTPGGVGSVFANSGLSAPHGLAFDNAGNLYVANTGRNKILKFTPKGVGSDFASFRGLDGPLGLAFDSTGNLYVANARTRQGEFGIGKPRLFGEGVGSIEKFSPGGVGSVFAITDLHVPVGLAFDRAGNLFAANSNNGTIVKITPVGAGSRFAVRGMSLPKGLAFDSAGDLYAANPSNWIEKFSSGGVHSIFANRDLSTPFFLAFTDDAGKPLRLPNQGSELSATWAMFAAGAVILLASGTGALLARRRLRSAAEV